MALACAFGNSLTLPLVFLMEILNPMQVERAAGYIALFLVRTPCAAARLEPTELEPCACEIPFEIGGRSAGFP